MREELVGRLVEILAEPDALLALPSRMRPSPRAIHRLAEECLGEDLWHFTDGRMLIWNLARHDGYNIPPYPMAGCGDVKEFLHDEGAANVPDWYRSHLGMDRQTYDHIYQYELVMVRNRANFRRVWVIPSAQLDFDAISLRTACSWVVTWGTFALSSLTDAQDPRLFKR